MTTNPSPAPLSPEREAEIRAWRDEIGRIANNGMKFGELAILTDLLAQVDWARSEMERLEEQHKDSLRRADELNNALMAEVQRYAEGTERPVLWSVYNRMHSRALTAEAERDELQKRVAVLDGRLNDAAMTRVWTNEDGKKFVFVEDIAPALLGLDTAKTLAEHCTAEYGGPGYTHCELPSGHDGQHESALGNMRPVTWGGAR